MDDGEVEPSSSTNIHGSAPVDSYLEDLFKNTRTCTHTHTCNPPGPDALHTHTCHHTHTQVFSSGDEAQKKPRKGVGNREAVRKYREKKKAEAAYLEEEVRKLRLLNQQLVRRVQGQAALEAEIMRLRGVLVGIRGRIDDELGGFLFQRECRSNGVSLTVNVGLPCEDEALVPFERGFRSCLADGCGGDGAAFGWARGCDSAVGDCQASEMASVVDCPISGSEVFKPVQQRKGCHADY